MYTVFGIWYLVFCMYTLYQIRDTRYDAHMHILPIQTPILKAGDNLAGLIESQVEDGDIVVVSSKAIATVEGAVKNLADFVPSDEARELAKNHNARTPEFYEAVLQETARMNGSIIRANYGVVLTELKPKGLEGSLLVPNAGLDMSNVKDGYVVGWPKDPVASTSGLGKLGNREIGIVISDSGLSPRRRGVTAFALSCCGFDPILNLIGTPDLFGNDMKVTEEAIADQLATAANTVMGNADQCIPAAIIRGFVYERTDFCGWVPAIERERDLYHKVI